MAYADCAQPKKWTVNGCLPNAGSNLDLQAGDVLEFVGTGDGGPASKVLRNGTVWGSGCLYSNGNGESISGTHLASSRPFTISIMASARGTIHEGVVQALGSSAKKPKL